VGTYNRQSEPVRTTPITEPSTQPMRRLEPERLCPAQKNGVREAVRRVIREP